MAFLCNILNISLSLVYHVGFARAAVTLQKVNWQGRASGWGALCEQPEAHAWTVKGPTCDMARYSSCVARSFELRAACSQGDSLSFCGGQRNARRRSSSVSMVPDSSRHLGDASRSPRRRQECCLWWNHRSYSTTAPRPERAHAPATPRPRRSPMAKRCTRAPPPRAALPALEEVQAGPRG